MRKLISGILDFRKNILPHRQDMFARLANGQDPDVLFITCSDSRVAPNWFASTDPGDLFVVRNVGNLVPPCKQGEQEHSVAAAIEFSLLNLKIADIVVCGHSGCGAIHAVCQGTEKLHDSSLKNWLNHASRESEAPQVSVDSELSREDQVSQRNVLKQIGHLKTYPLIQKKIQSGELRLHGWWFEIARGSVHAYEEESRRFHLIDDRLAAPILRQDR